MSNKLKSTLYFGTLLLALISYAQLGEVKQAEKSELANNNIEQVSTKS
jgi:hypothetical protein